VIICVGCGFNFKTGKSLQTEYKKAPPARPAGPSEEYNYGKEWDDDPGKFPVHTREESGGGKYLVVPAKLGPIPEDILTGVFASVGNLTDLDAKAMATGCYGILAKNLSENSAEKIVGKLQREGVEATALGRNEFPRLPAKKALRRAAFVPDHITFYDTMDRPQQEAWEHLKLFSASLVDLEKTERKVEKGQIRHYSGGPGGQSPIAMPDSMYARDVTKTVPTLLMDLLLDVPPWHYRIDMDNFFCNYLGSRKTNDPRENFTRMVNDIFRNAPNVICNRGANSLRQNPPILFHYPNKYVFDEESRWLMWQHDLTGLSSNVKT